MSNTTIQAKVFVRYLERELFSKTPNAYFVSFPKSGRTWIRLMLASLYADLAGCDAQEALRGGKTLLKKIQEQKLPDVKISHGLQHQSISQRSYFPSLFYRGQNILFLARDPRDVVISYYYYATYALHEFEGSLREFLFYPYETAPPTAAAAEFGIRPIINYLNAWISRRHLFSDFKVVYYEGMKQDAAGELAKIAKFLHLPATPDMISRAVEFGSFESARKLEQTQTLEWKGMPGTRDERGFKVRKGKVGGYKEEFSPEERKGVDEELRRRLDPFFERYIPPRI